MASESLQGQAPQSSSEFEKLTASGIWKGENESDVELMENYDDNPLSYAYMLCVRTCVCVYVCVCVFVCDVCSHVCVLLEKHVMRAYYILARGGF